MKDFLTFLTKIDQILFDFLHPLGHPFLDELMWILSDKWTQIPLYILIFWSLWKKFKLEIFGVIVGISLTLILADQTCTKIKKTTERLRPSHQFENLNIVKNYKGGTYGFPSSHAANTVVLVSWLFFLGYRNLFLILMILWSFWVSYSRIYLGVHFPFDVLTGWCIGFFYSILTYLIYKKTIFWIKKI